MYKLRGYAFSQLNKIFNKEYKNSPKRRADIEKYGFSVKEAFHTVRLMLEAEQILINGDLDLELNREILKTIRAGRWNAEQVQSFFDDKERQIEKLFAESKLQKTANEAKIKELLLNCLEAHFGSLSSCIVKEDELKVALLKIDEIINEVRLNGGI